jgi:hypothetical protein
MVETTPVPAADAEARRQRAIKVIKACQEGYDIFWSSRVVTTEHSANSPQLVFVRKSWLSPLAGKEQGEA